MEKEEVVGEARKIQRHQHRAKSWRTGWNYEETTDVCTFLIERFDHEGNPLQPVAVEIRARSGFTGALNEGDTVSLYDRARAPSGVVRADAVRNKSTGGIFGNRRKVDRGRARVPPP